MITVKLSYGAVYEEITTESYKEIIEFINEFTVLGSATISSDDQDVTELVKILEVLFIMKIYVR